MPGLKHTTPVKRRPTKHVTRTAFHGTYELVTHRIKMIAPASFDLDLASGRRIMLSGISWMLSANPNT